eukprot:CAMPEP_0198289346 /NCGR_PEP_ID=MMETSP1449-20131203/7557_1 /TAXON_ID=420275 /ORGANISM="Attheya septentrionalis, Strain CCMP2084" /LENGTH=855 /DNA_ID=CAMNT_0043987655 /DNA_START=150 /DNA_END=2717 /DNA_ORIENTATION=+
MKTSSEQQRDDVASEESQQLHDDCHHVPSNLQEQDDDEEVLACDYIEALRRTGRKPVTELTQLVYQKMWQADTKMKSHPQPNDFSLHPQNTALPIQTPKKSPASTVAQPNTSRKRLFSASPSPLSQSSRNKTKDKEVMEGIHITLENFLEKVCTDGQPSVEMVDIEYDYAWRVYTGLCEVFEIPLRPVIFHTQFLSSINVVDIMCSLAKISSVEGDVAALEICLDPQDILQWSCEETCDLLALLPPTLSPDAYHHLIPTVATGEARTTCQKRSNIILNWTQKRAYKIANATGQIDSVIRLMDLVVSNNSEMDSAAKDQLESLRHEWYQRSTNSTYPNNVSDQCSPQAPQVRTTLDLQSPLGLKTTESTCSSPMTSCSSPLVPQHKPHAVTVSPASPDAEDGPMMEIQYDLVEGGPADHIVSKHEEKTQTETVSHLEQQVESLQDTIYALEEDTCSVYAQLADEEASRDKFAQTVRSLEEALKLQMVKTREAQAQLNASQSRASQQDGTRQTLETILHTISKQSDEEWVDFEEMLNSFILENTVLDGDDEGATMETADVIWFLKELKWRFDAIQNQYRSHQANLHHQLQDALTDQDMSASAVDKNGQAVEPGKTYNDHIGNSDEEMAQLKSRVEELEEALAKCNTGAQNKSDISQRELDKSLFQHEELKGTNERIVVEIEHLKSQELESASQMEEIQCQHELAKQKHDRAIAETQHIVQAEKSNVASLETILQGKQHSLESLQAELKEVRQESLERQKLQEQESKGARTRIHYLGGLVRDMSQEMSLVNHKYEPKVTPEEQTEVESLTAALQDSEQKQINALETLHRERVAFAARIHEVNTLLHNVATKENSTTNV